MTSFATPEDLATFLEHTVDTARAELLLEQASAAIRSYTNTTFDLMTTAVRTVVAADHAKLYLRPVITVTSVAKVNPDLTVAPITGWVFDGIDTIYGLNQMRWITNPFSVATAYPYLYPIPTTAEITYTHGYATVPSDVKAVCVGMAGRVYETPAAGAITMEHIGDYSYKVAEIRGEGRLLALQADEKEMLDLYRRGSAWSVSLR